MAFQARIFWLFSADFLKVDRTLFDVDVSVKLDSKIFARRLAGCSSDAS
jgi:hypothetical protein